MRPGTLRYCSTTMSAPLYQRFDNDGEPPLFLISGPLPQHEQTSMPNRAADMATIDIVHQPQNADPEMSAPDAPKDYMTLSIITCLFCAWPVGLCAVCAAFDTQTNNLKVMWKELEAVHEWRCN